MKIKKIFLTSWIIIFVLLSLIILIPFSHSTSLSNNKIEMKKIKDKINQFPVLSVKGQNLNLNVNNFITSNAINNALEVEPYEFNFLQYKGYLQFNQIRIITINININGYKESIKQKIKLYESSLGNITNQYINKICSLNNNSIFAATTNGLYYSTDTINFNKVNNLNINNLNITNMIVNNQMKLLYLVNSNYVYAYNLQNMEIKMIYQGLINDCLLVDNNLYIATVNGLYTSKINNLINYKKIRNENIININFNSTKIYFLDNNGVLYQLNPIDNTSKIIFHEEKVITFTFSTTGTIYFMTVNALFLYEVIHEKLTKLKIFINETLKNIFISYDNYIYIISNTSIMKYNNEYSSIMQITTFLLNADNIFQNFDNTLYCYSSVNFTNIIFIQ